MTKIINHSAKAFLETARPESSYRSVTERLNDWREVETPPACETIQEQATRCINCGIPYCHGYGCPLGNFIPDFNRAVRLGDFAEAWAILSQTSPFPEFTSRVCPALCEASCSAEPEFGAVTVRQIEKFIVETAFADGRVEMDHPKRTGKRVAVIGSGPAGLAAALTLNRLGHSVSVYEKNKKPGGLLRYGIPDFKLEKRIIDRRVRLMEASGIEFVCSTQIGSDVSANYLRTKNDALLVAIGTPIPRDLEIPGRTMKGIDFALDFLRGQNRVVSGELKKLPLSAEGRRVVVIGGGDTGSDCVGTALRQGAIHVEQIEIMPKPPKTRSPSTPWPEWPYRLRTSSSHLEGGSRRWSLLSRRFLGKKEAGVEMVEGIEVFPVEWSFDEQGKPLRFTPANIEPEIISCDMVLLALGFPKRDPKTVLTDLGFTGSDGFFLCGDAASGPSLVVRAIADGLAAARKVDIFLNN